MPKDLLDNMEFDRYEKSIQGHSQDEEVDWHQTETVMVKSCKSSFEANLYAAHLRVEGIQNFLLESSTASLTAFSFDNYRLFVATQHLERAQELIKEIDEAPIDELDEPEFFEDDYLEILYNKDEQTKKKSYSIFGLLVGFFVVFYLIGVFFGFITFSLTFR
jgi:Holliday junction resolvase